jgi:hypothetical protein
LISVDNPGYLDAQTKLAQYQKNLGITQIRLEAEKDSAKALQEAKSLFANLQNDVNSQNPGKSLSQLQQIINQLESVKPGTTVYPESQKELKIGNGELGIGHWALVFTRNQDTTRCRFPTINRAIITSD